MPRACARIGCGLVVVLLLADAHAVPAPRRRQKAAAHFDAADRAFRARRFDEALTRLQAGYALEPRPEFLIAFAQTYRELGRLDDAVEQCERYRAVAPRGPLDESVRALERDLRRERARRATAPRDDTGDDPDAPPASAADPLKGALATRELSSIGAAVRAPSSLDGSPDGSPLEPARESPRREPLSEARSPPPIANALLAPVPAAAHRGRRALTWGLVIGSVTALVGVGLGVGLGLGLHAAPPATALGSVSFH